MRARRLLRPAVGLFFLGMACADRSVPLGEVRRKWCTPISAEVTLEDGTVIELPAPLQSENLCVCITEDQALDWDYRTDVVNELGYERCLEMVEEFGYDPRDSDCDWKRTAFDFGWWALSLGIPDEQFIHGDPPPVCGGGGPPEGCGG